MDRLISEQAVLDILARYEDSEELAGVLIRVIKELPSAEPYKGMTNGEVLKVVFPHEDVYKGEFGHDLGGCTIDFDWWNSPYVAGRSE